LLQQQSIPHDSSTCHSLSQTYPAYSTHAFPSSPPEPQSTQAKAPTTIAKTPPTTFPPTAPGPAAAAAVELAAPPLAVPDAAVPVGVLLPPLAPALLLAPAVAEPPALVVPAAELLSPLLRTPPRTVVGFVLLVALAALVL